MQNTCPVFVVTHIHLQIKSHKMYFPNGGSQKCVSSPFLPHSQQPIYVYINNIKCTFNNNS